MAAALPAIAIGMGVGSAVTGIVNASNENSLKNEAAEFNSARDLEMSKMALQQSAEDERRLRIQNKREIGDIRANYGASGVTTEGSALDVLRLSASNAELDALTVRYQGKVASWSYQNQAYSEKFSSQAGDRMLSGRIAGSIFSTGSQVASTYALKRT